MSIIPATQEVEVGGVWFQAGPGKIMRSYLKNKLKSKRTEALSSIPSLKKKPRFL
jgi:hypothetical protein